MLSFALALALVDATQSVAAPGPTPRPHPIVVTSTEPRTVRVGDAVTVTGSGFDQGSVVLLGNLAPAIRERSATRLVFIAPADRQKGEYRVPAFVISPGVPLVSLGEITVLPRAPRGVAATPVTRPTPNPEGPRALVSEKVSIQAGAPKSWRVDLEGANALSMSLACTGGEVEATLKPEASAEPVLDNQTFGGKLTWTVTQYLLKAPASAPLGPVVLTLSTKASEAVGCTVRVGRTPVPPKKP